MKKILIFFKAFYQTWKKIHLIDRCLIIFMIFLLAQLTLTLFWSQDPGEEVNSIATVVRTSTAAIFGYFLSANFIRNNDETQENVNQTTAQTRITSPESKKDEKIINQIGFTASKDKNKQELGAANSTPEPQAAPPSNKLQIIIATLVGLFCLCVLSTAHSISVLNPASKSSHDAMATISQFRDFLSGCVGFLIGSPTNRRRG